MTNQSESYKNTGISLTSQILYYGEYKGNISYDLIYLNEEPSYLGFNQSLISVNYDNGYAGSLYWSGMLVFYKLIKKGIWDIIVGIKFSIFT